MREKAVNKKPLRYYLLTAYAIAIMIIAGVLQIDRADAQPNNDDCTNSLFSSCYITPDEQQQIFEMCKTNIEKAYQTGYDDAVNREPIQVTVRRDYMDTLRGNW
jgi:hypothetical protein